MRMSRILTRLLGAAVFGVAACGKPPTLPTPTPGPLASTGPIAFVSDRDGTDQIYLANEDGSGVTRLTPGTFPAWSRDGRRIAFSNQHQIYLINVDGTGLRYLARGEQPEWSPDGRVIVFSDLEDGSIAAIDVSGSNRRTLYPKRFESARAGSPAWSPDGQRIAFALFFENPSAISGIWLMNADGSHLQYLKECDCSYPTWSPDSQEVAFETHPSRIDVSNANGTGWRTLVALAQFPDWTPDGRLIFTKTPTPDWNATGRRIFVNSGGTVGQQLIPEATAPARSSYSDQMATWRKQ